MKTKSNGVKPLTTGFFKTRQRLIDHVLYLRSVGWTHRATAEACGVSGYVIFGILKEWRVESNNKGE